ncbi:hypothetical protein LINPERPRIM_LOCUS17226 [Linum perenne]
MSIPMDDISTLVARYRFDFLLHETTINLLIYVFLICLPLLFSPEWFSPHLRYTNRTVDIRFPGCRIHNQRLRFPPFLAYGRFFIRSPKISGP